MANAELDSKIQDGTLVARVQRGETGAFEVLVDRHLHPIRTFIALKAPVPHLVDEIAHETFVFAFRNLGRFTVSDSFRAWLRAIAWNLLRAEVQRFSREQANQSRYTQQLVVEMERTGAGPHASREAEFLEQCMAEIPPELQELLSLKYREGRSSEEIGAALRRSLAWVRVVLFRVRQQLRECIERKMEKATSC